MESKPGLTWPMTLTARPACVRQQALCPEEWPHWRSETIGQEKLKWGMSMRCKDRRAAGFLQLSPLVLVTLPDVQEWGDFSSYKGELPSWPLMLSEWSVMVRRAGTGLEMPRQEVLVVLRNENNRSQILRYWVGKFCLCQRRRDLEGISLEIEPTVKKIFSENSWMFLPWLGKY